ncbi:MAG: tetratricopeptide repeat protein [Pseudomonadota bacterium]
MKYILATALALTPAIALAAGGSSSNPPTATATTTTCQEGYVYDAATKSCVVPQESNLIDDDARYEVVRELAYAGRYDDAQTILGMMDAADDRVMTYMGFTERKLGNVDAAMTFYQAALTANPDNILARSYMGQAYVEQGAIDLAQVQLSEIKARGGKQTWAAKSLEWAIQSGKGFSY